MNRTYLVLGSTGFIGTSLVKHLVKNGEEVISFSTSERGVVVGIEHIQGSMENELLMKKILKRQPDVVICLVGVSGQNNSDIHKKQSFLINVVAHIQLLENILLYSPETQVIVSSSRLEYGKPQYLPVDEKHPIKPLSHYGIHKHIVSAYCQFLFHKYALRTTILRTSNPYGPHPLVSHYNYNVINFFIDQTYQGKDLTIYGNGSQKRDYIYIDDFIEAIVRISKIPQTYGQIYNIGGGTGISLKSVAREIVSQVKKGKLRFIPWPSQAHEVETGDYISDVTKIKKDTGWKPHTSLIEGIHKTLVNQNYI